MVEYAQEELSRTFSALAAPARLAILEELSSGSRTVLQLADPFDVSLNAVSKHVKVLERAGLVRRDVRGREHHISLEIEPLREVGAYVDHFQRFWEARLDALEGYLERRRDPRAPTDGVSQGHDRDHDEREER